MSDKEATIAVKVQAIIIDAMFLSSQSVRPEVEFKDLDIDSLDLVSIVQEIEVRFCITMGDDKVEGLKTVGDLIKVTEIAISEQAN